MTLEALPSLGDSLEEGNIRPVVILGRNDYFYYSKAFNGGGRSSGYSQRAAQEMTVRDLFPSTDKLRSTSMPELCKVGDLSFALLQFSLRR